MTCRESTDGKHALVISLAEIGDRDAEEPADNVFDANVLQGKSHYLE